MCVILYPTPRYMRPEGPWQRRDFTSNHIQPQIDLLDHSRAPRSPSPHAARQRKEKEGQEKTKGKGKDICAPPRAYSALSPPPASAPGYISTSISPSSPVTGPSQNPQPRGLSLVPAHLMWVRRAVVGRIERRSGQSKDDWKKKRCVCDLLFCIPLLAAQRATAAAP